MTNNCLIKRMFIWILEKRGQTGHKRDTWGHDVCEVKGMVKFRREAEFKKTEIGEVQRDAVN